MSLPDLIEIVPLDKPVRVDMGARKFRVTKAGFADFTATQTLAGGASVTLDVDLAEQVLRDLFPSGGDLPKVTIALIQEAVCERFSLTVQELVSPRRSQAVAYPRQVAMYLSRELTDASLPKIGKEFGGRDHTTVLHANAKITRMISEDRAVYNLVQDLTARIKHRG